MPVHIWSSMTRTEAGSRLSGSGAAAGSQSCRSARRYLVSSSAVTTPSVCPESLPSPCRTWLSIFPSGTDAPEWGAVTLAVGHTHTARRNTNIQKTCKKYSLKVSMLWFYPSCHCQNNLDEYCKQLRAYRFFTTSLTPAILRTQLPWTPWLHIWSKTH